MTTLIDLCRAVPDGSPSDIFCGCERPLVAKGDGRVRNCLGSHTHLTHRAGLLRMDAVGIERRHRVATRLLVLVGGRAKPEHRVVDPLWRIELAPDEGERIDRARH